MQPESLELLRGTLDLLILRALQVEPTHGYGVLRWIERAQTALAANDPAAAQAALRGHARAFPRGHLSEEREALAVQVLCASGRADEARRAAEAFVGRHPTSPQAARVRRTCVDAR